LAPPRGAASGVSSLVQKSLLRRALHVLLHLTLSSAPVCRACARSPRMPASRAKSLSHASALSASVAGCRRVSKTFRHIALFRFDGGGCMAMNICFGSSLIPGALRRSFLWRCICGGSPFTRFASRPSRVKIYFFYAFSTRQRITQVEGKRAPAPTAIELRAPCSASQARPLFISSSRFSETASGMASRAVASRTSSWANAHFERLRRRGRAPKRLYDVLRFGLASSAAG
jgi:hypothetical protein